MLIKNVTLRVQTALAHKITTDFWRSRKRLHDSDPLKSKEHKIRQKNPPIRRVSTKGAKLQQTLQSFSRVSTQSFSRDSVQSSSFSRDSALGVRRGGSAGVKGRGGRGHFRLDSITLGYLGRFLFLLGII